MSISTCFRSFASAALAVSVVATQIASAALFVPPTITGTTASGLQWSAVATGTAMPIRTTSPLNGAPGAVAYFDVSTGVLQLDPRGLDMSLFNITYSSSQTNVVAGTPGPLVFSVGTTGTGQGAVAPATGATTKVIPAGTWATVTTFQSRIAATVSLTASPTLQTVGDAANIASNNGWLNQPWSFGSLTAPNALTTENVTNNFTCVPSAITGSATQNANVLGFGNYRSTFQYTVNGVVGSQVGAVIPINAIPEPSTIMLAGVGLLAACGLNYRRKQRLSNATEANATT
jgi:hypothetical protein